MRINAIITVRTRSSRLPNKCLLPFGDGNVLEHIIRRVKHYRFEPIVCTSIDSSDDAIERIAIKEKVKYFRGSRVNKIKRWYDCCVNFNIFQAHSVDADDPFFDGRLVEKSMELLNKGYDIVYPTESSSKGAATVGFSFSKEILGKACALVKEDEDTEMMWYYMEKIPGIKKIILPEEGKIPKVRLTLDYEEDYWLLQTVRRIVDNLAPRRVVDNLFRKNPDLYKINWFRNNEWKKKQLDKRI